MRFTLYTSTLLAFSSLTLLPQCTSSNPGVGTTFFEDSALGFEVEDFSWDNAVESDADGDGDPEYKEDGNIVFGGETHDVDLVNEVDVDSSSGGKTTLTVVDQKSGNTRIYSFVPTTNTLVFADDKSELSVVKNPDNTYTVDGEPAANGKAAVALLKRNPIYSDASAWGFIMTYSVCQKCLRRAATRMTEDCRNSNVRSEGLAVCDIMRDFCDCAICDKTGKADTCSKCP